MLYVGQRVAAVLTQDDKLVVPDNRLALADTIQRGSLANVVPNGTVALLLVDIHFQGVGLRGTSACSPDAEFQRLREVQRITSAKGGPGILCSGNSPCQNPFETNIQQRSADTGMDGQGVGILYGQVPLVDTHFVGRSREGHNIGTVFALA